MESAGFWPRCDTRPGFPAYLQGMERRAGGKGNRFPKLGSQPTYKEWKVLQRPRPNGGEGSSQPTYKEWKAGCGAGRTLTGGPVPSLPTRNGKKRRTISYPGGKPSSQPTYKEWKAFIS